MLMAWPYGLDVMARGRGYQAVPSSMWYSRYAYIWQPATRCTSSRTRFITVDSTLGIKTAACEALALIYPNLDMILNRQS